MSIDVDSAAATAAPVSSYTVRREVDSRLGYSTRLDSTRVSRTALSFLASLPPALAGNNCVVVVLTWRDLLDDEDKKPPFPPPPPPLV